MSKNIVPVSKLQKMMHNMHITHGKYISTQLFSSRVIENGSVNHSLNHRYHHYHHHHQKQQNRDRSLFFYKLRQKRKQRRLQQGPLNIHAHQEQAQQIERNKEKRSSQIKVITAIVGSSIARNISVKNIEDETNEVHLRFKSGSDCADALSFLQSNDGKYFIRGVHQLIFILGTNDLHRVGAFRTVRRIDYTIATVRRLYPNIKIIWQLLQQRTRKTCLLSEGKAVLQEIEKCNTFLRELAAQKKFDTIQPAIPIRHMYDGLHPSKYGVEMMEVTIKQYLQRNKILYSSTFSTGPLHIENNVYLPALMSIIL